MSAVPAGHPTDFDFFLGRWHVRHERLKGRLVGSTDWEYFEGTSVVRHILGGHGNVDDNVIHLPAGTYCAATLRAFDAASGQWSIWWLDGRAPGSLDVPMVGSFQDGTGTFYANETLEGRPIVVRFLWTRPAPDRPRWEQAVSADGGRTWEANWIMNFSRPSPRGSHPGDTADRTDD